MNTPSFREDHSSQIPALQLLQNLGWTYMPPDLALYNRGGQGKQCPPGRRTRRTAAQAQSDCLQGANPQIQ